MFKIPVNWEIVGLQAKVTLNVVSLKDQSYIWYEDKILN